MTSSSGRSCHRIGFENVTDGGHGPLTPPAAPPTSLVPALPATLAAPPEPAALALEPAEPKEALPPFALIAPPSAMLPAAPARMPDELPATPFADSPPPPLLAVPALLVRPAAPSACAGVLLPQAMLASSGETTATIVRVFAWNT